MKVKIKFGVRLRGMSPVLSVALAVAIGVYEDMNASELEITCCTDGEHRVGSLHHTGEAWDFGIHSLVNPVEASNELAARLGAEWDVVLETHHIHVEYDPG